MAETTEIVKELTTDEKLSQAQWRCKVRDAKEILRQFVREVHKDHTL